MEGKDPKAVFCIVIIENERDYPDIKRELTDLRVLS
jgi:hypothetical protein